MRKIFIFLLFIGLFLPFYTKAEPKSKIPDISDIRVEIKSQIKVLQEKKNELIEELSKATVTEKKEIKKLIREINEKIYRLKNLIRKYTNFNNNIG